MDNYLYRYRRLEYDRLQAYRDQLVKEFPELMSEAWLTHPTNSEDYILVVLFSSVKPSNSQRECFVSYPAESPVHCFIDLKIDYLKGVMNTPE